MATITKKNVRSFVWKNTNCRYGIPRVLVSDNRKYFDNDSFRLRLRIDLYLKSSKLGSRGQRVYGQKSYQAYYGRIEQQPEHLQERHRFD